MRKISAEVVSSKPISLARSAKIISTFAGFGNGASPTVYIYLQRTADSFNRLVQFHDHNRLKQKSQLQKNSLKTALESDVKIEVDEAKTMKNEEKNKKQKRKKSDDGADSIEDKKRKKKKIKREALDF